MCDQYNNRGCEVVDELQLELGNLREEKKEVKDDLMKDIRRLEERIIMLEMRELDF